MFRLFDIIDPEWNASTSAWAIDVGWLGEAGYDKFFIGRTDVCVKYIPADTSYQHGTTMALMFMTSEDDPIPQPYVSFKFLRYVYPVQTSKPILSAYSGSKPTYINMSFKPSYDWPARTAIEDVNNWGELPVPGATVAASPANETFIWIGVATESDNPAVNATYYVDLQFRHWITAVKTTVSPVLPYGLPSTAFIPASTWTQWEGYEESNDTPGHQVMVSLDTVDGGDGSIITANESYLPQWYNNP